MHLSLINESPARILTLSIAVGWTGAVVILAVAFFMAGGRGLLVGGAIGVLIGAYVSFVAYRTARSSPRSVEMHDGYCILVFPAGSRRVSFSEIAEITNLAIRLTGGGEIRFNWTDRPIVIELQRAFALRESPR